MIVNMTQSLRNIVLSFIGNIWWNKDTHLNGIGFGVMGAHPSLRVVNCDILYIGTRT
jgi:hypothetical protein